MMKLDCANRWHETGMGQVNRCRECPPLRDYEPDDLTAYEVAKEILLQLRVPQDLAQMTRLEADGRFAGVTIRTPQGQLFRIQVEEL
jgi:hypothetical protein